MYVGNLSYDVKYRDLIEFMRGGGWGRFSSWSLLVFFFLVVDAVAAAAAVAPWSEEGSRRQRVSSVIPPQWESDQESLLQSCENVRGRVWIRPMSCGGFDGP